MRPGLRPRSSRGGRGRESGIFFSIYSEFPSPAGDPVAAPSDFLCYILTQSAEQGFIDDGVKCRSRFPYSCWTVTCAVSVQRGRPCPPTAYGQQELHMVLAPAEQLLDGFFAAHRGRSRSRRRWRPCPAARRESRRRRRDRTCCSIPGPACRALQSCRDQTVRRPRCDRRAPGRTLSMTWMRRSAYSSSSSVARKASTRWCGSLAMKPTVSDSSA